MKTTIKKQSAMSNWQKAIQPKKHFVFFVLYYFSLILLTFNCLAQPTWVISGAPIGDTSVYIYFHKNDWAGKTLTHDTNNDDSVRVSNIDTTGIYLSGADTVGIHVYRLHLACNISSVTNNSGRIQLNHPKPRDLFTTGDSLQLSGFTNYNGWDTIYAIVNDTAFVMDIAYTAADAGMAVRPGVPDNTTGISGLGGNDRYFGVFKTDTSISYDFTYYYAGNPYVNAGNENDLELFKRDSADASSWTSVIGQTLYVSNDTIGTTSQNTEFILGSSGSPLPIELLSFDATPVKDSNNKYFVRCSWSTATEINNDYFTVKRSKDGTIFSQIGTVKGAGNSSTTLYYEFDDWTPYTGLSYYQLKQTDYDSKYSYSKIVAVYIGEIDLISIAPSPAEKEINYTIRISETVPAQVKVINVLGQAVINETEAIEKGITQKKIDISMLASGFYMLSINTERLGRTEKKFAVK